MVIEYRLAFSSLTTPMVVFMCPVAYDIEQVYCFNRLS